MTRTVADNSRKSLSWQASSVASGHDFSHCRTTELATQLTYLPLMVGYYPSEVPSLNQKAPSMPLPSRPRARRGVYFIRRDVACDRRIETENVRDTYLWPLGDILWRLRRERFGGCQGYCRRWLAFQAERSVRVSVRCVGATTCAKIRSIPVSHRPLHDQSLIAPSCSVRRARSFRHAQSGLPGISAIGVRAEAYFSCS
jgi:hypothetical protein